MLEGNVWRNYSTILPTSSTSLLLNNKIALNFCSTSYLALNWNTKIQTDLNILLSTIQPNKLSSLGSNYLGGTQPSKLDLEQIVAGHCGFATAIAFSSGWCANYAVANYLGENFDLILSDIANHNSIIHGLRCYKDKVQVLNVSKLTDEDILILGAKRIALIYGSIEGITGVSPTINLSDSILNQITVVVDESHSFGMFGFYGIEPIQNIKIDIRLLGFSKALGNVGALLCASEEVRTWIEQKASIWIFSTPLPPYIWEINKLLFISMQGLHNERSTIFMNSIYLRNNLNEIGLKFSGKYHITGLNLPSDINISNFEDYLLHQEIFFKVSGFPSVPKGKLFSRITINPYHTKKDIDKLINALKNWFYQNSNNK